MSSTRGFTLMELMITVAIVGILGAIAFPSYTAYVQRGWRTEAKSSLMQAAQAQERQFTAFNTYSTAVGPTFSGDNPTDAKYNLAVTACATGPIESCYLITATPNWADALCGRLTIDSQGTRGQERGTTAQCWDR